MGLRSTLGKASQRAPRRAGSWASAVLVLVLGVLGVYAYTEWRTDTVEVLVLNKDVPPGEVIETGEGGDLQIMAVSGMPDAILASETDLVEGKRAKVGMVAGQVLTEQALTEQLVPAAGERLVAARLDVGRVPGGLDKGDLVNVLVVPPEGATGTKKELESPLVLATDAVVDGVRNTQDGGKVVTLVVADADADRVAAHGAAGQVTIVQSPAEQED